MKKILNRLVFLIERKIIGGAQYQLLFIAVIITLISLFAGVIIYFSSPDFKHFGDAVWWAFLRMSDPGYLGDDTGLLKRLISTIVTILGYVLFMSSLVAILTQWLNGQIRRLESGYTPISMKGHILILGWTNRTAILIKEIILSEEHIKKFLKRIKIHIAVLDEEVSQGMVYEIKEELGPLWDSRMITLRSGNQLKIDHLLRVDFLNAGVIILPGTAFGLAEKTINSDMRTIKTILAISHYWEQYKDNGPCPDLVAEIFDMNNIPIAISSYAGRIEIIASYSVISRLMAQELMHQGILSVYSEIIQNDGNEFYLREAGESFSNIPFSSVRTYCKRGIPVGIIQNIDGHLKPFLNPPAGMMIKENYSIIIMAENFESTELQKRDLPGPAKISARETMMERVIKKKVLVLGWNKKVPLLIKEIQGYKNISFDLHSLSLYGIEMRESELNFNSIKSDEFKLEYKYGDYCNYNYMKDFLIENYDAIIMVANDWVESSEESDTRTILGYHVIKQVIKKTERNPDFIVELLDADNSIHFEDENVELIISPRVVSYMISQVSLKKNLNLVFNELFKYGTPEIYLAPGTAIIQKNTEMTFSDIEYIAYSQDKIALGVITKNSDIFLNPKKDKSFTDDDISKIIIMGNYNK